MGFPAWGCRVLVLQFILELVLWPWSLALPYTFHASVTLDKFYGKKALCSPLLVLFLGSFSWCICQPLPGPQAGLAHDACPHTWVELLRQTGQEWILGPPCLILRLSYHVLLDHSKHSEDNCGMTMSLNSCWWTVPFVRTKQNKTQKTIVLKDHKILSSRKMLASLRDNR